MKIKLITGTEFVAAHSLDNYEDPHPHLWKLELILTGAPIRGRIVDLPSLITAVKESLRPFENVYLNECALLPAEARAFPTCETLGVAFAERLDREVFARFREENPSLRLLSVKVSLCSVDEGAVMGSALVEL